MRQITTHAINPCNESINLMVYDEPGQGGACHLYQVIIKSIPKTIGQLAYEAYAGQTGWKSAVSGAPLPQYDAQAEAVVMAWEAAGSAVQDHMRLNPALRFQNGPVKEDGNGVNGITHEVLLAVLIDRIRGFQSGPWKCPENALALSYLEGALAALNARTKVREARGVEGTHQV